MIWHRLVDSRQEGIVINHRRSVDFGVLASLRRSGLLTVNDATTISRLHSEHQSKEIRRIQYTQKSFTSTANRVTEYQGVRQMGRFQVSCGVDLRHLERQVSRL